MSVVLNFTEFGQQIWSVCVKIIYTPKDSITVAEPVFDETHAFWTTVSKELIYEIS